MIVSTIRLKEVHSSDFHVSLNFIKIWNAIFLVIVICGKINVGYFGIVPRNPSPRSLASAKIKKAKNNRIAKVRK